MGLLVSLTFVAVKNVDGNRGGYTRGRPTPQKMKYQIFFNFGKHPRIMEDPGGKKNKMMTYLTCLATRATQSKTEDKVSDFLQLWKVCVLSLCLCSSFAGAFKVEARFF